MARYVWLVLSNPTTPNQEDEYNSWYDARHLDDVLRVPGFVSAQRFKLSDVQFNRVVPGGENAVRDRKDLKLPFEYIGIYEIESDDLAASLNELKRRAGTDEMPITPALDMAGLDSLMFVPIGPVVTARPGK